MNAAGICLSGKKKLTIYQNFLKNQPPEDPITHFARGYEDYLQCPLQVILSKVVICCNAPNTLDNYASYSIVQPLLENLESQTYEIFERDPVKYTEYQKVKIGPFSIFSNNPHNRHYIITSFRQCIKPFWIK